MKYQKWIRVMTVLCAVSLAVMVSALLFGTRTSVFIPPPFDPSAQTGVPDVPAESSYQELDAIFFRLSLCGRVTAESDSAVVYLTNPADNAVWIKLRLLDENGNLLGETGLIRPGEYIRQVPLQTTPEPGALITMKVMAYEPDTYHSQGSVVLHTQIGE